MKLPDDWVFQIGITIATFWLTVGLAYCVFAFETKAGDRRLQRQWDREDEANKRREIDDQYYKLANINRNLVNVLAQLGKPGHDDVQAVRSIELALGDAIFELWHLTPRIDHEPLLELATVLEMHIRDFDERASTISAITQGVLDLGYVQESGNRIINHEGKVRDAYREWLGKEPLVSM